MKKYDNKTIEKLILRYFNIRNFEISKFPSFYISSFKILTPTRYRSYSFSLILLLYIFLYVILFICILFIHIVFYMSFVFYASVYCIIFGHVVLPWPNKRNESINQCLWQRLVGKYFILP